MENYRTLQGCISLSGEDRRQRAYSGCDYDKYNRFKYRLTAVFKGYLR